MYRLVVNLRVGKGHRRSHVKLVRRLIRRSLIAISPEVSDVNDNLAIITNFKIAVVLREIRRY